MHLNTVTMEASITAERKEFLLQELHYLCSQHECIKRQLLSLIGKLFFSCKVLPPGRTFCIDLLTTVKQLHHHIHLTSGARLYLQWWLTFLPHWSGRSLILESHWTLNATMLLFTESEGWGHTGQADGYRIGDHLNSKMNITWKELHAIIMAVHTWGVSWQHQKILFSCDNLTVVDIWAKGSTKSPEIMVLYGYYIFVPCVITLLLVFNTSLVLKTKLLMPFSIFKTFVSGNWLQMQRQHQPTSLHDQYKPSRLPHAAPLSWCCRQVNLANIPVWTNCIYIFLLLL